MNNRFTKDLFQTFPRLYRGHKKPATESRMCFGFECGDGWFPLVRDLSEAIEVACEHDQTPMPEVVQVKEKFGGLRIYVRRATRHVAELLEQGENDSLRICEECGKEGGLCVTESGWYKAVCSEHARALDMRPARQYLRALRIIPRN